MIDSRVYLCLHRCIPEDRNPLGQPFLKSTSHFRNITLKLRAIPQRFGEHHDALFLDTSSSISSEINSHEEQTVELAVAHRPPPGCLLSTLKFLSSIAQGRMTRLHELCIGSYSATVYRLKLSWLSVATCDQWGSWLVIQYVEVHKGERWEVLKVQVQVGDISNWCYLQADANAQEGVGNWISEWGALTSLQRRKKREE